MLLQKMTPGSTRNLGVQNWLEIWSLHTASINKVVQRFYPRMLWEGGKHRLAFRQNHGAQHETDMLGRTAFLVQSPPQRLG